MDKWNYGSMKQFNKIFALASAALIFNSCGSGDPDEKPVIDDRITKNAPNIVFILSDDLGYGDLSLNNSLNGRDSVVNTPNIDSIAARGINFSNAYVASPVCSPSRSGFICSRFPSSMGLDSNESTRANFNRIGQNTLPYLLKQQGYSTAVIGKWDIGGAVNGDGLISSMSDADLLPHGRGFDYFYGFPGGQNSFYPTGTEGAGADGWH